jgi:DNA-binding GntR family transcriptional regulator
MLLTDSSKLSGLERTSLRAQAVTALRLAITTGGLAPGTLLVESELSESLQISRGTLREAFRQLQQEGLISTNKRGRLSVRNLDAKEIRNIFSVRGALESLAAIELCELPDRREVITQLRKAMEEMEAAAGSGLEAQIEADLKFHLTLCSLADNETLLHSWKTLEGSIRMCIMFAGLAKAVANMDVRRHAEIVDAIETGDAVQARETITAHMTSAAQLLIS